MIAPEPDAPGPQAAEARAPGRNAPEALAGEPQTGALRAAGAPAAGTGAAPPELVLGSASPRRLELLRQIGIVPSRVIPAEIDETPMRDEAPRDYVRRMAREKAQALTGHATQAAVLCADTAVVAGRRILGKPADAAEARDFLERLSGRRHRVLTSVALAHAGRLRERLVETTIRLRPLTPAQIDSYLASQEWQGKAGGYAIQGRASAFVTWMQGSYSGVVGLPLAETAALLAAIGIRENVE